MQFIDTDTKRPESGLIQKAANFLRDNYPIVFPTDTTWGILMRMDAINAEKLHKLRRENLSKPFLAVIPEGFDWKSLVDTNKLPKENFGKVNNFWPGTNTLLFPKALHLRYPQGSSIALRMPAYIDNPAFNLLLKMCNFPLLAPSFNRPGESVILTKEEAIEKFAELPYAFWDKAYRPLKPSALWDLTGIPIVQLR
ncbi:MAG: Threonylcarbamoyl-AMP synthase [Turneriella sp.]|nr:Threonylcarbamoyl-AMP synthase [Turneriella sp.]